MADPVKLTVVEVRADDRWQAVAVIDGRLYPDKESFDQAGWDAFDTLGKLRVPAQYVTRRVYDDEPPSPLPTWEEYRATLAPKGAGETA
jgi:hypothetical protein